MECDAEVSNFVIMSDEDLVELVDSADSTNSKKVITYALKRLEAFAKFTGITTLSCFLFLNIFETFY